MARTGKKRICGRRSCSCSWRNMKWRGAHRRLSGCPNRNRRTINAQNERASYICMAGYLLLLFALKYLELAIIHASDSHFMHHLLRSRPLSWVLIIIISLVFPIPSGPPNGSPVASSFAILLGALVLLAAWLRPSRDLLEQSSEAAYSDFPRAVSVSSTSVIVSLSIPFIINPVAEKAFWMAAIAILSWPLPAWDDDGGGLCPANK